MPRRVGGFCRMRWIAAVTAVVWWVAVAGAETVVFDAGAAPDGLAVASDRDSLNPSGVGKQVCDDFTVKPGAHTVTGIEWLGMYGVLGQRLVADAEAPEDAFALVFYDDDRGMPGDIVAEYRPRDVARVSREDGTWTYRYALPSPLSFEPGRTYHLAVVNNIPGSQYWCWAQDGRAGRNHSAPVSSSAWVQWPGNCSFRLTYTPPPVQASSKIGLLAVVLAAAIALRLHRFVL